MIWLMICVLFISSGCVHTVKLKMDMPMESRAIHDVFISEYSLEGSPANLYRALVLANQSDDVSFYSFWAELISKYKRSWRGGDFYNYIYENIDHPDYSSWFLKKQLENAKELYLIYEKK